jgi:protease I
MGNSGKRVAVALAKNFEDVEATSPIEALVNAGAEVTIVGLKTGPIEGKKGAVLSATKTFSDVSPEDFDLLVIPGGGAP